GRVLGRAGRAAQRQGRGPVQGRQGRQDRFGGRCRRLTPRGRAAAPDSMAPEAPSAQKSILLGRIHGAFGVRGEVKLESFTDPERGILRYQPWTLRRPDGTEAAITGAKGR